MTAKDLTQLTDPQLLSEAIARSKLSVTKYATDVLTRDERTVRRWLAGEQALPKEVRRRLERDEPSVAELQEALREIIAQHRQMAESSQVALDRGLLGAIVRARRLLERRVNDPE